MSFDKLVERIIKEGMAKGEFDNLAGKGEPIDLTTYFALPEDLRVCYTLLKNAGVAPPQVEMLKEIEVLKAKWEKCPDESEKSHLKRMIEEKLLEFNLQMEQYKRR